MADTLSQAEIDALLDTFADRSRSSADAPAEELDRRSESYDFSHPDLLSRDQVRALQTLHEGFAQAVAKRLSTELLANVSAAVVSVDRLTYGEFLSLLPTPTVLSVIEVPELEGNVAIELNPNIAFSFIDRLLGGFGTPIAKIRSLTAIEQALMERVLQKCCQELDMIWAPILNLSFQPQSIEGNPELARVVGPNEMVILVSMEIRIHDVAGMMNLCLPYVVMEPAIQRLGQATTYPRKSGQGSEPLRIAIEGSVRSATLQLDVDLGTAEVTLGELLDLGVGDVLQLHSPSEGGARASVEGVPRIDGRPGRSRGHVAFEVLRTHPNPDAQEAKK